MARKKNSRVFRMPEEQVEEVKKLSDLFELPSTDAQRVRDKFFKGDFEAEKVKEKNGEEKLFLEMKL